MPDASGASTAPYYRAVGREVEAMRAACRASLPVLLKGPTGCGKSRLVEAMAAELGRPLVTLACNDETSSADLLGRWIVRGGDTEWLDGPATRAVREGAMLYLDEVAEARDDVLVVLHPLADHRRTLWVDRRSEELVAAPGFQLVASYNPGYRRGSKDLKPSTRQRFVTVAMGYPTPPVEVEVLLGETGCDASVAKRLVAFATKVRALHDLALPETVSTRLLVHAARLITSGMDARLACEVGVVQPLSDEPEVTKGLTDLAALMF